MSDHNGGDRPRPQYGEYASPEEQRAAIKQPAEWQLEEQQTDAAPPQSAPGMYQPGSRVPGARFPDRQGQHPYAPPAAPARSGTGDRLVTFVLLAYGLYNVIDMIANAVQGGGLVRQSAQVLDPADGQMLAGLPGWVWTATAVTYAAVWLIALVSSLRAMRGGRVTFWIPLLGGVVAALLVVALVVIALGQNPALLNNLPTPGGTGTPT